MNISLDNQLVQQQCPACGIEFQVVRGSVFDDGKPCGLYLIALHGHAPQGRLAHLAIALLVITSGKTHSIAAAMDVLAMPEQFGFSLVQWKDSPWQGELYLGQMLAPEEVRSSPQRGSFFHIADHVVGNLAEVKAYFA